MTVLRLIVDPVYDGEVEAEGGRLLQQLPGAILRLELASAVVREPGEQCGEVQCGEKTAPPAVWCSGVRCSGVRCSVVLRGEVWLVELRCREVRCDDD